MPSSRRDAPRIDNANQCVWRGEKRITLPPKAWAVLQRLRESPDQIVSKQVLLDAAWPETHVIDVVLNNTVADLREALGDNPKQPRFIETVHRRGYRWIGPSTDGSPPQAARSTEAPSLGDPAAGFFVGRSAVLAELERSLSRAAAGRRQLVFVTGESGIGKTAVVDHLIQSVVARNTPSINVACGRCIDSFSGDDAYRPIVEAIEELVGRGDDEVRDAFKRHAPIWLLQMPDLLTAEERAELQRTVSPAGAERMQREIERALETATAERTIVLVLEDLHWCDAATVSLLWALATRREPARLLIIATYRPIDAIVQQHPIVRLKHELVSKRQCVELALEGLDVEALGDFLARRFVDHQLPETFAAVLEAQTSGNPLFVLNALDDFAQRGWLVAADGHCQCVVDLEMIDAAIPGTTRDIIAFRLDQLPAASREILEAASVVGMTFATQSVAAASDRSCAEIEAECEGLTRAASFLGSDADLEWPDGSRGRQLYFRHALYRQVLYGRVSPTRRQLLHRRIAERLQTGFGDRVDAVARQMSLHHERAGDAFRAADLLEALAQRAYARFAIEEAEVLLGHAVAVVKGGPQSEIRQQRLLQLTIAHGLALASVRGSTSDEPVRRAFDEAYALAASISTPPDQLAGWGLAALTHIVNGRLREARNLGEQQLVFAGPDAPLFVGFNAHSVIGFALLYLGEIDASRSHLEAALAARSRESTVTSGSDPFFSIYDPIVQVRMFYGLAETLAARGERGWASVEAGLAQARSFGTAAYLGPALSQATGIAIVRGDFASARSSVTELLVLCETNAQPLWKEAARVQLAWLDVRQTPNVALLDPLRTAVDEFRLASRVGSPRMFHMLADACLMVGQVDEASRALDQAFDTRGEECFFDAELFRQRAAISLARASAPAGRNEIAEQFLERAIEVAAAQGTHLFGLRATIDQCRLWLTTGKRRQAQERLASVLTSLEGESAERLLATDLLAQAQAGRQRRR